MYPELNRKETLTEHNFFNAAPTLVIQSLICSWNNSLQLLYWRSSKIETAACLNHAKLNPVTKNCSFDWVENQARNQQSLPWPDIRCHLKLLNILSIPDCLHSRLGRSSGVPERTPHSPPHFGGTQWDPLSQPLFGVTTLRDTTLREIILWDITLRSNRTCSAVMTTLVDHTLDRQNGLRCCHFIPKRHSRIRCPDFTPRLQNELLLHLNEHQLISTHLG